MFKTIDSLNNHELITLAKAFINCPKWKSCSECPCNKVLCGQRLYDDIRYDFVLELANRLEEMEQKLKSGAVMKIFEKRVVENYVGRWHMYYLFGKIIKVKLVYLNVYE